MLRFFFKHAIGFIFQRRGLVFNYTELTESCVEMVIFINSGNLTSQISEKCSSLYRTGKTPTVCKYVHCFSTVFTSSQNYIPISPK